MKRGKQIKIIDIEKERDIKNKKARKSEKEREIGTEEVERQRESENIEDREMENVVENELETGNRENENKLAKNSFLFEIMILNPINWLIIYYTFFFKV